MRHLWTYLFRYLEEEQERIVAILDEAFEGIAAAKVNAERIFRMPHPL